MGKLSTIISLVLLVFSGIASATYSDYVDEVRKASRGSPSEGAGEKINNYIQGLKTAEEVSTIYFENDILSPKSYSKSWKWLDGKVYYIYSSSLTPKEKLLIKGAMDSIMSKTNQVKFIPRTNQNDYIRFENTKTGCWSALGRVGGKQIINLQYPQSYDSGRTVEHLIFHALGVAHEHNRKNRDTYITITPGNIIQMYERNFEGDNDHKYNTAYDPFSIMHFTALTNSDNGQYSFVSIDPNVPEYLIGWSASATPSDISKLEEIYK